MAEAAHIIHRRRFWILSIVNWCIFVGCWGVSAYLGIAKPTNMFLYSMLFIVALVALLVAILAWIVARFGLEPAAQPVPQTAPPSDDPR